MLFPTFARLADDVKALSVELARATRALATASLPAMALVAAAAPQLVSVIFGHQWEPAIPIVQVLAIAGALQAVYQPSTTPLVLGLGHAKLNLRYAWLTTMVSTLGIVAGLPFGPFGVAVGYCAATWYWSSRRVVHPAASLCHDDPQRRSRSLVPGAHVAIWVAAAYLLIAVAIPGHDLAVLAPRDIGRQAAPERQCCV